MKKVKIISLTAGMVLAMVFTFSCSSDDEGGGDNGYTGSYGSVTYGGKTYRTVEIGTQTWFAENLNYDPGTGNSACYDNQASNCATYGRLYDWSTAMAVCPSGWHLPSNADWDKLFRYVDGSSGTKSPYSSPKAGKYLKATSGWNNGENGKGNGNGIDTYGFSALPGGKYIFDGMYSFRFFSIGNAGLWWSASEGTDGDYSGDYYDFAYIRYMLGGYRFDNALSDNSSKSYLFSVRCVKD
jgi:uncharacterized protein (TIGR02145 family)